MERKSIVVGTAGHIDHGKTALVRALTGVDTDRLDEEKRRGITIDLGFAPLDLEGVHIGFVDVPGHERFVKNMLAGAGGIDAVLIVVAADESVMPQTREHVEICDLLEIGAAVVAITKTDLVDAETIELVALEITELLEGTRFAGARIVEVSSATGAGLETLRSALTEIAGGIQARSEALIARLPVDRVFTMKGFGTVVTGTLVSGTLRSGMAVELQPSGKTTSVKNLQVHGESVEAARAGHRVAVNLAGLGKDEIERGEVVVPPKSLKPSPTLDLQCRVLASSPCELATNQRVRFHIGSAELIGRLQILSGKNIGVGGTGFARIRLESPASALVGDRYVIRRYSPMVTIAGGTILDNRPPRMRDRSERIEFLGEMQRAGLRDRCALLIENRRGAVTTADLTSAFGLLEKEGESLLKEFVTGGRAVTIGEQPLAVCSASYMDAVEQALLSELKRAHEESPFADGIALDIVRRGLPAGADESIFRAAIDRMQESGKLSVTGGRAVLGGHKVELTSEQRKLMEGISAAFREGAFAPPPASQVIAENGGARARPIFELMVSRGELVKIAGDFYYHREILEEVVAAIRRNAEGGSFSVPQFKDWFGISRKFAIPLLEYLDSSGVTYRDGDARKLRNS